LGNREKQGVNMTSDERIVLAICIILALIVLCIAARTSVLV